MNKSQLIEKIILSPADLNLRKELSKCFRNEGDKKRAHFIELQLILSAHRLVGPLTDCSNISFSLYMDLETNKKKWIKQDGLSHFSFGLEYTKGLVGYAKMSGLEFLNHSAELFSLAPIRHLDLTDATGLIDEILNFSKIKNLASLGILYSKLEDSDLEIMGGDLSLSNIKYLDLTGNNITNNGIELLINSKNFRGLEFLEINGNPCDDPRDTHMVFDYGVLDTASSRYGDELEAKFGPLRWLSYPEEYTNEQMSYNRFSF